LDSEQNNMAAPESNLAQQYQKKTDKEHILDNPDTYIGSVENVDTLSYIYDDTTNKIIQKEIQFIPGLYKLFDEGIVNCRDHVIRMKTKQQKQPKDKNVHPVSHIDIDISEDGVITMLNDGNGIDVAKHPEYDLWIPEMIFGHLRTSTNYNKKEKKIVGGKNGFGFKLVLIWSSWGKIETVDSVRGLKYTQEFKDNLNEIGKPSIRKCKTKPYTKIMFKPDYKRLNIDNLTPDMRALLKRRTYDVAAVTDKKIKVKYNNDWLAVKHFQQYVDLYIGGKGEKQRYYEESNQRWEYVVSLAPNDEFTQVSFVNGIYTSKGGKHVDYFMGQLLRKLCAYIKKKKKVDVKPNTIKEQLMVFIRCDIENPSFDSQTKDYMNTSISNFGSTCKISDKFVEKIAKMGVMNVACALNDVKQHKNAKKTDGTKSKNLRGIPKLIDANFAGTSKASQCTIIFCEGDSAKAGIVSGLSKEDRNYIGVYPMKGKIFNVRGESAKRVNENKEIAEIKKILGLQSGKVYSEEDVKTKLRYGKVLFMTDQDLDGSHIKGLGINMFQSEWESLVKIPDFIGFMNTPILKATKGKTVKVFYNDGEYEEWKKENDTTGWKIKYYKGLGTSTGKEFREYFKEKKIVRFQHEGDDSNNLIDMVFNKKRADDRKAWLSGYERDSYLDTNQDQVTYEAFINREMIHFSKYDCDRSIPNLMDGFKTSLRKILYAAFKKNLNAEIKVAQFSGYVSEHSGYHHGEASLNGAIVNLAQDYVGSNNINLFLPNGQFGTRLQGGKDSASERYIFTALNPITRAIFPEADDKILHYLDDDGFPVEPVHYGPIIPMILVNGSKGIGTGFSTDIMCYQPLDIIDYLKKKVYVKNDEQVLALTKSTTIRPYYEGFKGTIIPLDKDRKKYLIRGCYEYNPEKPDKVRVTELPIGFWTDSFKQHLENLMDVKASGKDNDKKKSGKKKVTVKDYSDMSTDTVVDFTITFANGVLEKLLQTKVENDCNAMEKLLKLYTTNTTTNMHMFDHNEKLKKYDNVIDIINDYYDVRLELYKERKAYQIKILEKILSVLSNKARYITEVLNDTIDLRRKKKHEIREMLSAKNYDVQDNDEDYKYLIKMPMDSVSEENVVKLSEEKERKEAELDILRNKTIEKIWHEELSHLEEEYETYKVGRTKKQSGQSVEKKKKKLKVKKKKKLKIKLKK